MKRIVLSVIAFLFALALPSLASAAASFEVTTFSCTPSETAINDVFTCTARIQNTGDSSGSVGTATLYPDSGNWLESSTYSQAGSTIGAGNTGDVTFSGLRATRAGNNGFARITLDDVTDTYVADNNVKQNVIDVSASASNEQSSAAMGEEFDVTTTVIAGGNIDIVLTFSVTAGGCSIGSQASSKTLSNLQNGNQQSHVWTVTQGTSAACQYSISAAATSDGGVATKTDTTSSSVSCSNCPTSSSSSSSSSGSSGAGSGGGAGGILASTLGELASKSEHTVTLGSGERVDFLVDGEKHSVSAANISAVDAEITVRSSPQTAIIGFGGEKEFDVTDDGKNDLRIKLQGINSVTKKVTLIITPLYTPKEKEKSADASKNADRSENSGGSDSGNAAAKAAEIAKKVGKGIGKVLVVLIILAVIAVFFTLIKVHIARRKAWSKHVFVNRGKDIRVR